MIRAIVLRGDFDDADYNDLVALIRTIDDRHPERLYEVVAVDPDKSAIETADAVMNSLPPREGRETTGITILRRKFD